MKIVLPYRLGVGMMLVNREGQVFAGKRIDTISEAWQMPQGGIDKGESPRDAALRELYEEVGLKNVEIIAESKDWFYYDLPTNLIDKVWHGKYIGQKQKWFLMKITSDDSHINIATAEPEFLDWKWVDKNHLPDLIVPFKRDLYNQILAEFAEYF